MKKYLESTIGAFSALFAPILFICFPLLFGIFALCSEVSGATIFLMLGGIAGASVGMIFIKGAGRQLYSWGHFTEDSVQIKTLLCESTTIEYKKCRGCGIGYYIHGIMNSNAGSTIYYIFLSYDMFDEKYRTNMNYWKPTQTQIKVAFSKKLYSYLLEVLPPKQAVMLSRDYKKYFG